MGAVKELVKEHGAKIIMVCTLIILTSVILTGCGETFSGMGKDIRRVGKGAKTVIFREK
ncbi:MAG: hypothetical protein ABID09_01505 [Candidatus Omnitrophota bacterium]